MSLLLFQNNKKKQEQSATPPANVAPDGNTPPPADTNATNAAIVASLVKNYGMSEEKAKSFVSDFTPIITQSFKDETDADKVAKAISGLKYAVAMKATDGTFIVSTTQDKAKIEEVYSLVKAYNEKKTPEASEQIFNASEDEIEGTSFEDINGKTFVKGMNFLVINPRNVISVEI